MELLFVVDNVDLTIGIGITVVFIADESLEDNVLSGSDNGGGSDGGKGGGGDGDDAGLNICDTINSTILPVV